MTLPTSRNTTYAVGNMVKSADLNDIQDYLIAHHPLINQIHQGVCYAGMGGNGAAAIRTMGRAGYIYKHDTSKAYAAGGLIIHHTGDTGWPVLAYITADDEIETSHDAAGAGKQRYDILSVKLTRSGMTTSLSQVVTTGAETSGWPVEPSTPAGYVKIAAIMVNDSGINFNELMDYRWPLGDSIVDVPFENYDSAHWAKDQAGIMTADGAAARNAIAYCPITTYGARIWKVGLAYELVAGSSAAATLMTYSISDSGTQDMDPQEVLTSKLLLHTGHAHFDACELKEPCWTTCMGEYHNPQKGVNHWNRILLLFNSGATHADKIWGARFYVSGAFYQDLSLT